MKEIEKELKDEDYEKYQMVDWKDTCGVFDAVEAELTKYGLELEVLDDGSDQYMFRIIKIKKGR